MSGNKNIILISVLVSAIFAGCAIKNGVTYKKQPIKREEIKTLIPKIDQKKYKELSLITEALYLKYSNPHKNNFEIFYKLYKATKDPSYLYEAVKNIIKFNPKKIDEAIEIIKKELKKNPNDEKLNSLLATLYLKKERFKEALEVSKKLLKKRKTKQYYIYAAISYLGLHQFEKSVEYYKKAYKLSKNVDILNQITTILYQFLNKKEEAVKLIEKHIKEVGCDYYICDKLAKIYLGNNDVSNAIGIYKKMYEKYKEKELLEKIVRLYLIENRYKEAINYVISTGGEEEILMKIFMAQKNYQKAYEIAKKLYKEKKDPKILANLAMLEYEKSKIKDKKVINKVINDFEKAMLSLSPFEKDNALFFNYYGYLLIDHDIDVKKGIEYVKKALRLNPTSVYYLDSLAWGYYKIGKCKEAFEIMDKIIDKTDEDEIIEHYKKIKKCLKKEDKR